MQKEPELVPLTKRCQKLADIESILEQMTYPAIYKPATKDYGQSFYRSHNGSKAIECESADKLRAALLKEINDGFDLVVQEKILFESVYDEIPFYLYADANGNISMMANGIKEIIEPFPFGTAIALRFASFPELLPYASRIVKALEYRGILMIEFVRDLKDGGWKVIEINPRHWLFNGFYQRLGFNYSQHLYDDLHSHLSTAEKPIMASSEASASQHIHLDLWAIAEKIAEENGKTPSFDTLQYKLDDFGAKLSSAYLDFDDPEPGVQRLADMCAQYGWNIQNTREKIIRQLN